MGRYNPPWTWLTKTPPDDLATVWIVRIGMPEPPMLGTWVQAVPCFYAGDQPIGWQIPFWIVSKWRAQTA